MLNRIINGLCNPKKKNKMDKVKGIVMAMIPVALGVAAGMLLYDKVKQATSANAVSTTGTI